MKNHLRMPSLRQDNIPMARTCRNSWIRNSSRAQIITERDVTSLDIFNGKSVVVVGYGKSALDMATLAARTQRTGPSCFPRRQLADPRMDPGCAFHLRLIHPLWQCDDDKLGTAHSAWNASCITN